MATSIVTAAPIAIPTTAQRMAFNGDAARGRFPYQIDGWQAYLIGAHGKQTWIWTFPAGLTQQSELVEGAYDAASGNSLGKVLCSPYTKWMQLGILATGHGYVEGWLREGQAVLYPYNYSLPTDAYRTRLDVNCQNSGETTVDDRSATAHNIEYATWRFTDTYENTDHVSRHLNANNNTDGMKHRDLSIQIFDADHSGVGSKWLWVWAIMLREMPYPQAEVFP